MTTAQRVKVMVVVALLGVAIVAAASLLILLAFGFILWDWRVIWHPSEWAGVMRLIAVFWLMLGAVFVVGLVDVNKTL